MKNWIAPFFVLFFWLALIGFWSSGFTTFTIFSKTLVQAGELPREFPELELINQDAEVLHLDGDKSYKLVNFVYLSCPEVCHKVNNRLESIYHKLQETDFDKQLHFVTLSFDLDRDNVERIRLYREYFKGKGAIDSWDFAVPNHLSQAQFDRFLSNLGIWKFTDPQTGLTNHSIYVFLLSPENKIIRVFDPARQTDEDILQKLNEWISHENIRSSI